MLCRPFISDQQLPTGMHSLDGDLPCSAGHWNAVYENKDYVSRMRQLSVFDSFYPRDLTLGIPPPPYEQCEDGVVR